MSDRRIHASIWLIFFVNGAVLSSWAPRIPDVATALQLGDAQLGMALLGIAAGAIPAMAVTGRLTRRLGTAPACLGAAVLFTAGLPLIAVARGALTLTAVLVVLGAASGLLDVAMNSLGIALQRLRGKALLSGLHSGYSLGVLTGSAGAVAATALDASVALHFTLVAVVLLMLTGAAAPAILRLDTMPAPRPVRAVPPTRGGRLGVPASSVAVLAICGLLLEGLITDWSALLLTRDLQAPAAQGALTLTAFSLAMFASRASADRLLRRAPDTWLLSAGALVTMAVIGATSIHSAPWVMTTAVIVIGLAAGPVFPLAIARAARHSHRDPAVTTARVSILGYSAYLAGPPLIGLLAQSTGLPVAFALTAASAAIGIALTARPTR